MPQGQQDPLGRSGRLRLQKEMLPIWDGAILSARHWSPHPRKASIMAIVTGTENVDFIHRSGDGRTAAAIYNEIASATVGADVIDGGDGDDIIYGDDGDDQIIGGLGADKLYGGEGDDSFVINDIAEIDGLGEILDGGGGAFNRLQFHGAGGAVDLSLATISSITSFEAYLDAPGGLQVTLTAGQLAGFSAGLFGTGGMVDLLLAESGSVAFSNVQISGIRSITGGNGNDLLDIAGQIWGLTLNGGAGSDVMSITGRGPGVKTALYVMDGGEGDDRLTSRDGLNTLLGGQGRDILKGGKLKDSLDGGEGKDQLTGGGKQDILTGGSGRDLFILSQGKDSSPYVNERDIITDFSQDEGDRIDLSRMDGDTTIDGDGAFFLGGSSFTNRPGELIQFTDGSGNTILAGDSSGDGFAEFEILLNGAPVLVASDFIL